MAPLTQTNTPKHSPPSPFTSLLSVLTLPPSPHFSYSSPPSTHSYLHPSSTIHCSLQTLITCPLPVNPCKHPPSHLLLHLSHLRTEAHFHTNKFNLSHTIKPIPPSFLSLSLSLFSKTRSPSCHKQTQDVSLHTKQNHLRRNSEKLLPQPCSLTWLYLTRVPSMAHQQGRPPSLSPSFVFTCPLFSPIFITSSPPSSPPE